MITISGISPSSARQGDSVIITGTGFTGVTQVLFGNVAVTSFVINSNTQITAVIGNGASGDLYIQGSNGAALDTSVFTFLTSTLPVINSFSPSTQAPGLLVTITGTGFTGTTAVKFGGVNALVFTVISDTEIQAYPNISGSGLVTVTNASGSNSLDGFTLILVKIKMPDSPVIGRVPNDNDLFWIWDSITTKLCQITAANAALYFGTGGGGGGGGGGNIYTALGSPFKVRNIDDSYSFDGTDSKVIDIRLLGKNDYVVYST
ncbi:MAG: IPT/TIG domain-containing protein, partial [Leifsonia sp.]